MGEIREFFIKMDGEESKATPTANGGLFVSGEVVIVIAEDIKIRGIRVALMGKSECSWLKGADQTKKRCWSRDVLVNGGQTLVASHELAPVILTAGTHSYPFALEVKSSRHLPSTLTGNSQGGISYNLEGEMDRVGKSTHDYTTLNLSVWNPQTKDLREHMIPVTRDEEHTDCCLCCASGPVILQTNISKTAIRLGSDDVIEVSLSVDNNKNNSITPQVYLEQMVLLHASNSLRCIKSSFCQSIGNEVLPRSRGSNFHFKVGPIREGLLGTIDSTSNITLEYNVVVALAGSRFKMKHPIFIGLGRADTRNARNPQTFGHLL